MARKTPDLPSLGGPPTLLAVVLVTATWLGGCGGGDGAGGGATFDAGEPEARVAASGDPDPRPDIVLVVADDMRWDLMSGKGHPFLDTPHLDAFAVQAASMDAAFVPVALCSPSRAAILTGREPHLASAPGIAWRNNSFLQTQRTFVEDLQAAGYATAYIGKWHLGDGATPRRGFDHWESFDWLGDFFDPTVHVNGEEHHFSGYVDDVLAARAEFFMQSHRDDAKPVFLMVGLKAPHLRFEYPARHEDAFDGVGIPRPDTYDEDFSVSGKLQAVKDWLGMDEFRCGLDCFEGSWDRYITSHYRAILGLDDSVGTLRRAVRHRSKGDNTLFVYTSDNGYSLGDHGLTEKHMLYEEPIRVPFLVDFPGSRDRGLRFDGLVSTLDIAPTALDYAGIAAPPTMQGRSLRPLAEAGADAPAPADWRDELFFAYDGWQVAVRTDRHKYIESLKEPGHVELYDLRADPKETRSVHADPAYAATLQAMDARLDRMIVENRWSPRVEYPVTGLLATQAFDTGQARAAATAVSRGTLPSIGADDALGLSWRRLARDERGFQLASGAPANSSVLVALPIERLVDFDPFVQLGIRAQWPASMYVDGQEVWSNRVRLPINHANPPLVGEDTLVVLRFDGRESLRLDLDVSAPQGTLALSPDMARARPSLAAATFARCAVTSEPSGSFLDAGR